MSSVRRWRALCVRVLNLKSEKRYVLGAGALLALIGFGYPLSGIPSEKTGDLLPVCFEELRKRHYEEGWFDYKDNPFADSCPDCSAVLNELEQYPGGLQGSGAFWRGIEKNSGIVTAEIPNGYLMR